MTLAFAIGKFDALHRGHRALIAAAAQLGEPCLLQFSGMAELLGWDERPPLWSRLQYEIYLDSLSAEINKAIRCVSIPFADIQQLQPEAFIAYLRERHDFSAVVTGDNFRFGHKRVGDVKTLQALGQTHGFAVETVSAVLHAGKAISSSRVREAINDGYIGVAAELLGRPYLLSGLVGKGEQRGRQIGFPTANIQHIENLIPATGVYAARIRVRGQWHLAAVNIGYLPSISDQRPLSVEAHILDWSGDCYDEPVVLEFKQRLREEMKFDGLDALKQHIAKDVQQVREAFQ